MTKRELQNKYLNRLRENDDNPLVGFKKLGVIYNDFLDDGGNEWLWEKITDILCREAGMIPDNMVIPR